MVLVRLLSDDKERQFTLNIPSSYFEWLSHQEDKIYREIGKTQSMSLSFTKEYLFKELIESILLKRLEYTLKKIWEAIDIIVIGLRYRLQFTGEIQLDNYIRPLNRQFEKSSFMHRKEFLVRYSKSQIEMDFIKFFIKRM